MKKKTKQNSLWFSQFHPSFLKTGARYIPAQGIISDQSVCFPVRNIDSMRRCAPAGSPSQCPAHGKDSHLVPAGRGQPCAGASASLLPASCSRATWQPARHQQSGNPMLFPECNPNTTLRAEVGHNIFELTASGIWPCILPTSIFWRWKSFCFSQFVSLLDLSSSLQNWSREIWGHSCCSSAGAQSWWLSVQDSLSQSTTLRAETRFPMQNKLYSQLLGMISGEEQMGSWPFFTFPIYNAVLQESSSHRHLVLVFQWIFCTGKIQILSLLFFLVNCIHSLRMKRIRISMTEVQCNYLRRYKLYLGCLKWC